MIWGQKLYIVHTHTQRERASELMINCKGHKRAFRDDERTTEKKKFRRATMYRSSIWISFRFGRLFFLCVSGPQTNRTIYSEKCLLFSIFSVLVGGFLFVVRFISFSTDFTFLLIVTNSKRVFLVLFPFYTNVFSFLFFTDFSCTNVLQKKSLALTEQKRKKKKSLAIWTLIWCFKCKRWSVAHKMFDVSK